MIELEKVAGAAVEKTADVNSLSKMLSSQMSDGVFDKLSVPGLPWKDVSLPLPDNWKNMKLSELFDAQSAAFRDKIPDRFKEWLIGKSIDLADKTWKYLEDKFGEWRSEQNKPLSKELVAGNA